jgi:hypothetical protein
VKPWELAGRKRIGWALRIRIWSTSTAASKALEQVRQVPPKSLYLVNTYHPKEG